MHRVLVSDEVREFLRSLDEKTKRICKTHLRKLSHPYPGRGPGDKEGLIVDGEEVYRLHISRRYTAFYIIEGDTVRVLKILPIQAAHRKYGF